MSISYLSVCSTWKRKFKKRVGRTVHGPLIPIFAFAFNSGLLYFGYFVVPDDFKLILLTWLQNFSGNGSTDALKTSFEMLRDFTILFLPNRANFRLFQSFKVKGPVILKVNTVSQSGLSSLVFPRTQQHYFFVISRVRSIEHLHLTNLPSYAQLRH